MTEKYKKKKDKRQTGRIKDKDKTTNQIEQNKKRERKENKKNQKNKTNKGRGQGIIRERSPTKERRRRGRTSGGEVRQHPSLKVKFSLRNFPVH